MAAHKHAELLQEIADEAKVNERFWEAFECNCFGEKLPCKDDIDLFDSLPWVKRILASAEVE